MALHWVWQQASLQAPCCLRLFQKPPEATGLFIVSFYLLLIGSKIVVACVTWLFSGYSQEKSISKIMKIMGVVLLVLGSVMIYDGISMIFLLAQHLPKTRILLHIHTQIEKIKIVALTILELS
jgi:hypothetical protein